MGVLIGHVKMSVELQLNHWSLRDEENLSTSEVVDIDTMIEDSSIVIVKMAICADGLINLRVETGNIEVYQTFTNYCSIHFIISMNWRYKA